MPRYFFDIDDGETPYRDDVGIELKDDQAARDEAARALGELAKEYIPQSATPQKNITMWVRSEDGTALLSLSFSFAIQPVSSSKG